MHETRTCTDLEGEREFESVAAAADPTLNPGPVTGGADRALGSEALCTPAEDGNSRNGVRPRLLNRFGLGRLEWAGPRDRPRPGHRQLLPVQGGADAELETLRADCLLAWVLSPRAMTRITENHLGQVGEFQPSQPNHRMSQRGDGRRIDPLLGRPPLSNVVCG